MFSTGPLDPGKIDLVHHSIVLEDTKPFKQSFRKIPPGMYEEVVHMFAKCKMPELFASQTIITHRTKCFVKNHTDHCGFV